MLNDEKPSFWDSFAKYLKSKRIFKRTLFVNGRWLHQNSKRPDEGWCFQRMQRILAVFRREKRPMTDREVAVKLGFKDMNAVRPRITEAIKLGYLSELDDVTDALTKHLVRRCEVTATGLAT